MFFTYLRGCFFTLILVLLSACTQAVKGLYPPPLHAAENKTVYVVGNGWHTGIIAAAGDLPQALAGMLWQDPQPPAYVEFGWGDEGFYQTQRITSGMALKAILWPTDTVLHVVYFAQNPRIVFAPLHLIRVELSAAGFKRMMDFIAASFARDGENRSVELGPGIYGNSRFYRARGTYHAFNTCNSWTAKAVRAAGFPITVLYALTADNVFYQLHSGLANQSQ